MPKFYSDNEFQDQMDMYLAQGMTHSQAYARVQANEQADAEEYERIMSEQDDDYEYDGQPDEAQEWYDFDPEC